MTIILKPFSAPTVQFPKKEKPSILNSYSTSIFLLNFIGIISISSMRVLFQPPILLWHYFEPIYCVDWMQFHTVILFYCVYLFAATALSIWCITHLYIDYLSAPLDQIHLSYTLHLDDVLLFQFSFRGRWSHAIFYVLRVTSLMKQHEECRRSSLRCHLIHANSNLQCEQQRRADAPFPLYWSSTWHSIKTYFSQHHSALLALRDIEKQIAWALLKSLKIWSP